MNKDPAIERMIAVNELTEILCGKPCDICCFYGQRPKCMPVYTAEKIVDAGWRKASEVAREIFAEIDKILGGLMVDYVKFKRFSEADTIHYAIVYLLEELKNKYTEEGKCLSES